MRHTNIGRRRMLLASIISLSSAAALAQRRSPGSNGGRAPMGLTWGVPVEQVTNGDASWTVYRSRDEGSSLRVWPELHRSRFPNAPRDSRRIDLLFGHRNRLFRVFIEGEPGEPSQILPRYRELSSLLTELYGSGRETVTRQPWLGRPEAHSALRRTDFTTAEVEVVLLLMSGTGNENYWFIRYNHSAGVAEFNEDRRTREREAL